jgi:putative transposase
MSRRALHWGLMPQAIRSDNGPEFVSKAIQGWLEKLKIRTLYVAPESPWENGYAESFHSKLRDEFLQQDVFETLSAAGKADNVMEG